MSDHTNNLREVLTDAIRYWEPRRIFYNVILIAVFALRAPAFFLDPKGILSVFELTILANVAYCTVYIFDVPAQLSGLKSPWLKLRTVIYGITLATIFVMAYRLTRVIS